MRKREDRRQRKCKAQGGYTMSAENGFLFFYDWTEVFERLAPKEFKELFLAMLKYQRDGVEPPQFTGKAEIAAMFLFPQISRRKYCMESGKKGGAKRVESGNGKGTVPEGAPDPSLEPSLEPSPEPPLQGSVKHKDKDKDIDKDKDQDQDQDQDSLPLTPSDELPAAAGSSLSLGEREGTDADGEKDTEKGAKASPAADGTEGGEKDKEEVRFLRFWEVYPRKLGKSEARRVFQRLPPSEEFLGELCRAVGVWKASSQWAKENGQFIPYPATFLKRRLWEDLPETGGSAPADRARGARIAGAKDRAGSLGAGDASAPSVLTEEPSFDTEDFFTAALRRSYGGIDPRSGEL